MYTKGPWRAVNTGKHWNNPSIDNWQIWYSDKGECVVDHVYEADDAWLIASAPELLEALMHVKAHVHMALATERIVDAAIAKATGK